MDAFLISSMLSSAFPTPLATAVIGSSQYLVFMFVSCSILTLRFLSREPPPAKVIPLSAISEASSGGVLSKVVFMAFTMEDITSSRASVTSLLLIFIT